MTLSGEVSSEHLRRKAQDLAQSVLGVQHVHNELLVVSRSGRACREDSAATTDHSDPADRLPQRE